MIFFKSTCFRPSKALQRGDFAENYQTNHLCQTDCLTTATRKKARSFHYHPFNKKPTNKSPSVFYGADDETRTRDSLLGRQILYQLSYVRIMYYLFFNLVITAPLRQPARLVRRQADTVASAPSSFALLALPLAARQLSYVRIISSYIKHFSFSSLQREMSN